MGDAAPIGRRPRRRPLLCREVRRILQAYLDAELAPVDALAVVEHLQDCSACWADAADYRQLTRLLARLRVEVHPDRLVELEAVVEELAGPGSGTR